MERRLIQSSCGILNPDYNKHIDPIMTMIVR